MTPLMLQLLRRVAVYSLVLAVLLLVVPRLLAELGILGPTPEEEVERAARAMETARTYGATEADPAYQAASKELEQARVLAQRGQGRAARTTAARAQARAIEAQRAALAGREEGRRRAQAIVGDLDRLLNELEDLYGQVTPGLPKAEVSRLLSAMKTARTAGAALFLAYEQGNFQKVIDQEQEARAAILSVRDTLRGASAQRPE